MTEFKFLGWTITLRESINLRMYFLFQEASLALRKETTEIKTVYIYIIDCWFIRSCSNVRPVIGEHFKGCVADEEIFLYKHVTHTRKLWDRAVRGLSIIEMFSSEVLLLCCGEHFHLLAQVSSETRKSASESNRTEDRSCILLNHKVVLVRSSVSGA